MKPWPGDAVMIVAANEGEERRDQMEVPVAVACRDCGAKLMACTYTIGRAVEFARGRPVRFFCVPCSVGYDVNSIAKLVDHSGGRGKAERESSR